MRPLVEHVGPLIKKLAGRKIAEASEKVESEGARMAKAGQPEGEAMQKAGASASRQMLEASADQAIKDVAKGVEKGTEDAVGAAAKSFAERLKDLVRRVFDQAEFPKIWVGIEGGDFIVYGEGSTVRIIRVRISVVKEYVVEKTQAILNRLQQRQILLDAAREATDDAIGNLARKEAINVTEELGEHIAKMLVKREFPGAKLVFRGSGANTLDLVFQHEGSYIVCEAKGGMSRLQFRKLGPGIEAQQGTLAYLDGTLKRMLNSEDEATRGIAQALSDARKGGTVRYVITKTGELSEQGSSLAATLSTIIQPR
jgi:hypothetical protein